MPRGSLPRRRGGAGRRDNVHHMAARITLKAINQELARIGDTARLARGSGYFYFQFGEATRWLDRTVQVSRVSDLDMKQWIGVIWRSIRNLPPCRSGHGDLRRFAAASACTSQ